MHFNLLNIYTVTYKRFKGTPHSVSNNNKNLLWSGEKDWMVLYKAQTTEEAERQILKEK